MLVGESYGRQIGLGCKIRLQLELTPYAYAKASQKMGFTVCTSSCKVKHARTSGSMHYRVKQTLFRCNTASWPVRSGRNFPF